MKGLTAFSVCWLMLYICTFTQTLTGMVLNTAGKPVPDATVQVLGTALGASTDNQGNFVLSQLPDGELVIRISCLGYETADTTIDIGMNRQLTVQIKPAEVEIGGLIIEGERIKKALAPSSFEVIEVPLDEIQAGGSTSVSDALSHLPGISQLSTGPGISKPVIRGVQGSRIGVNFLKLAFENQQWQDEHGLGLPDAGIDRIGIIKGPAGLLYGPNAMGGVIILVEEDFPPPGRWAADFSSRIFSNTRGIASDAGIIFSGKKFSYRLRGGFTSHADYSDGQGERVLDSRFSSLFGKASLVYLRKNWKSENHFFTSKYQTGFILEAAQFGPEDEDSRWSRSFQLPHHLVLLNIFSSTNSFKTGKSEIQLISGFQSNQRQEQEGGNKISLDMLMTSVSQSMSWKRNAGKNGSAVLGASAAFHHQVNFGSRTIVPDADMFEAGLFGFYSHKFKNLTWENGLRLDVQQTRTYATAKLNTDPASPGKEVVPINKWYPVVNGSTGINWSLARTQLKLNFSTGFRAPNLAEISSNGLHEGSLRYEIGSEELKTEQNFSVNLLVGYQVPHGKLEISVFGNRFRNYIYLAPDGTEFVGFDIFRYYQQDAFIKGGEAVLSLHDRKSNKFHWENGFSFLSGTTAGGNPLPLMPPAKLTSTFRYFLKQDGGVQWYVEPGLMYTFKQDRPARFETETDGYFLIQAGTGLKVKWETYGLFFGVTATNLLNRNYFDHLSRFKYFGLYNPGRNLMIHFKLNF